jgi:hypothetical protein
MIREPFANKWIGAAFFWLLKGFRGKYSDLLIAQYDRRNMWTGYILSIIFFIIIIYLFYKRQSP